MSIMLDLSPTMVQEARNYAKMKSETLEQLLVQCIEKEFAHRRKTAAAMAIGNVATIVEHYRRVASEAKHRKGGDEPEPGPEPEPTPEPEAN